MSSLFGAFSVTAGSVTFWEQLSYWVEQAVMDGWRD